MPLTTEDDKCIYYLDERKKFCYSGISFQTLSKAEQTFSTKLLISFGFFKSGTGIKHHYLFHVQTRNIVDCGMNSGIGQIKSNRKSKSQHQNHGISNENEKYSLKCTISSLRFGTYSFKA